MELELATHEQIALELRRRGRSFVFAEEADPDSESDWKVDVAANTTDDPDELRGLADTISGTLEAICNAIEAKHGTT